MKFAFFFHNSSGLFFTSAKALSDENWLKTAKSSWRSCPSYKKASVSYEKIDVVFTIFSKWTHQPDALGKAVDAKTTSLNKYV